MLRDTRRSAAYFAELLPEFDEGIEETQQALDAGNFVLPDEQLDAAHQLYELAILRAVAHYSSGASQAELVPLVAEILPLRQQLSSVADRLPASQQVYRQPFEVFGGQGKACGSANINRYIYALWWLGLLVATQADEAHIQQALASIGNAGRDALLDRIAARLGCPPEAPAEALLYPALYRPLLAAFDAGPATQQTLLGVFLDHWYEQCQDADWHDNHLCDCEFVYTDYYVGYWSFEALLVARLLGVDDQVLQDHAFYPGGLSQQPHGLSR
ncbi:DUF1911 domain-containing protein [Halomonas campisalis]|uniref:DUF1911 domain-containing protein n=1 Tax=Billgrantia campisalis TaxID=74661 RepID=A0ABS9P822_9GAMM|nr:PoNe immunity protein domain-containing protein [Halomonas campisalis]MCG6657932.1 DUF1911 domain-containing protein [Halomonas campisalis]MDR5863543.1 DUF1911 domain-containing protein [Halomonas campisalis]